jgi:nicotinate-nucleotide adenylyltransferase
VTRVGILGGTFHPPHLGHLPLARHAREELGLERVVLMPAHGAPHKPAVDDPGPAHRLHMSRLTVKDTAGLSVCELEIERGGPSYTVDTLRAIHASYPDAQLTFIVGADTARTLPAWREPGELLALADLAVAARAGSTGRREVVDILDPLTGTGGRAARTKRGPAGVKFLEMPVIEISSSVVRERVARGEPIEELVGLAVARYIAEHDLYRGRSEVGADAA